MIRKYTFVAIRNITDIYITVHVYHGPNITVCNIETHCLYNLIFTNFISDAFTCKTKVCHTFSYIDKHSRIKGVSRHAFCAIVSY